MARSTMARSTMARGAPAGEIKAGTCYHVNYDNCETRFLTYRAIKPNLLSKTPFEREYLVSAHQTAARQTAARQTAMPTDDCQPSLQTEYTTEWWCECETKPWVGDTRSFLKRLLIPIANTAIAAPASAAPASAAPASAAPPNSPCAGRKRAPPQTPSTERR